MKLRTGMLMAALVLVAMAGMAMAAETTAKEQKEQYTGEDPSTVHYHLFGESEWLDKFHNPTEGVVLGLDQRIRQVYGENITSMNRAKAGASNENYWYYGRFRTRLSAKFEVDPDVDINTRLIWEWFSWNKPPSKPSHVDFDEAIFDRLNITMRNFMDSPWTVVVGRQDIILGTGWLVLDGNPADGSRSIFFDAIRATYACDTSDTKIDLMYIHNYDAEDKWLKPFNHRDSRHLTQGQDERGGIVYLTNNSLENTQVEGYYIYKEDRTSSYQGKDGPDAEIHTFGGALQGKIDQNWGYRAELAKQFGRKNKNDLNALAFNGRVKYQFNDAKSNALHIDYEYMSGDDTSTSRDEGFDPLWGDYPHAERGGDLPIYVFVPDSGNLGEMSNFHRVGMGHSFQPHCKWTMETLYNLYWADEPGQTAGGGNTTYSNSGRFRGHMLTGYLKYKCCKQLTAHFLLDYFIPGSYFDKSTNDPALFARFNLQYTF